MSEEEIESLTIPELEKLICSAASNRESLIQKRSSKINETFDFSESNVIEILRANDLLNAKMNEVYDRVYHFKTKIDQLIATGNNEWKNYRLEGDIYITPYDEDDILFDYLSCHINSLWGVSAEYDKPMDTRSECLVECVNHDFELFNRPEILRHNKHFCFLSHTLFVDDAILSLNEMVKLKEEDIKYHIEISIIE